MKVNFSLLLFLLFMFPWFYVLCFDVGISSRTPRLGDEMTSQCLLNFNESITESHFDAIPTILPIGIIEHCKNNSCALQRCPE